MEASLHNLYHSLETQGLDLANYLQITGQDEQAFADDLRERAERALKMRVLLEGIGAAESIKVADDELASALDSLADSSGRPLDEVRSAIQSSGQEQALAGDIPEAEGDRPSGQQGQGHRCGRQRCRPQPTERPGRRGC